MSQANIARQRKNIIYHFINTTIKLALLRITTYHFKRVSNIGLNSPSEVCWKQILTYNYKGLINSSHYQLSTKWTIEWMRCKTIIECAQCSHFTFIPPNTLFTLKSNYGTFCSNIINSLFSSFVNEIKLTWNSQHFIIFPRGVRQNAALSY